MYRVRFCRSLARCLGLYAALIAPVLLVPGALAAEVGEVLWHQKISDTEGGFTGELDDNDAFGVAIDSLGDLDEDGVDDLAVAAYLDDDGGPSRGAVWILFVNNDGTVKSHQKISDTEGGFTGQLDDFDSFGSRLASIGDLDGDGTTDLAVGADRDDDGGTDRGAVWILFLNDDGTVETHQKISSTEGAFTGDLKNEDCFGVGVASVGDLDGDGVGDIAVGARFDDDGGTDRGAVWILFLNNDGTVRSHQKISDTEGGFTGELDDDDRFGTAVAGLGDLDGDDIADIVVGATEDDDGGQDYGAIWILFLNSDGTVKSHQKISDTEGDFVGTGADDDFGVAVSTHQDLDGDGIAELVVGAHVHDDGGNARGAVWILFLNADGTVKAHQKISSTHGGFEGELDNVDYFGRGLAFLSDQDGDGVGDLAVGAPGDDDGGTNPGAVWILFLNGGFDFDPPVEVATIGEPSDVESQDFTGTDANDIAVTELGETPDDAGNLVLLLNDGTGVEYEIVETPVGKEPSAVAVADFDGMNGPDAAVCNAADNNVTILLNDGTGNGTFLDPAWVDVGATPSAIAAGDFNNDTFIDLAVANRGDNTVSILINDGLGGFTPLLPAIAVGEAPSAVAAGDFDGDTFVDLAVANEGDNTVMIFLNDGGRGVYLADIIPVGLDPGVLEPEDLDDDDEIDMVIGNRGSGTVGILLWYGPGYYTLFSLPVGADPSSIETSDLDGDGDPDILVVAGAEDDRAVQILRNEFVESGVLNFSLAAVVAEDPNLRLTGANDLNSNGLPDIIAVNAGGEGGPAAQDAEDGTVDVLLNAAETCPADFDGDRHVNTADLLILLGEWGTDGGEGGDCDRDGDVDTADLLFLLADWGDCPGNYPCPWDFNNDDVVDELDQAILMDHWGDCPDPPEECPWDLNGDGVVDGLDLMEVIDHFGPCP